MQLRHHQQETSWESHGWISVSGPDGAPFIKFNDFQHNRQLRAIGERASEVVHAATKAKATLSSAAASDEHEARANVGKQTGFLARLWQRVFGEKERMRFASITAGGAGLG